ncbi:MAG: hypothetical protein Q9180_002522 [Flavoplaca navasiana]
MRSLICRAVNAVPCITSKASSSQSHGRLRPYIRPRRTFCSSLNAHKSTPSSEISHNSSISSPPDAAGDAPNAIAKPESPGPGDPKPAKPVDKAHYGSASRRAGRNIRKPTDIPPCHLPQRFLEQNVIIGYRETLDKNIASLRSVVGNGDGSDNTTVEPSLRDAFADEQRAVHGIRKGYPDVWNEIRFMVGGCLNPPASPHTSAPFTVKQHLVLHCPREGSTRTLNALIRRLAYKHSADLINIDAQDIAEIGGNYLDEPGSPPEESLSNLSYDVHVGLHKRTPIVQDLAFEGNGEVGEAEEFHPRRPPPVVKAVMLHNVPDMFKVQLPPPPNQQPFQQFMRPTDIKNDVKNLKMETFVDTLLHACSTKRIMQEIKDDKTKTDHSVRECSDHRDIDQDSAAPTVLPPVIIQVNDYFEMYSTVNGGRVLDALHDALYERRKEGQRFLLIGTCAAKDFNVTSSKSGDPGESWESNTSPTRTITVPVTGETGKYFKLHHANRTEAINTRHLQDMIKRLASNPEQVSGVVYDSNALKKSSMKQGFLTDSILSADQVHQVAAVAIGLMRVQQKNMSARHIWEAIGIVLRSNKAKHGWISEESKEQQRQKDDQALSQGINKKGLSAGALQAKLRSQCNKHEKRLLHGVIDPMSIRTTFADVRAPKETIEMLKTLTSLSLLRPDAFTYGVLATDKITGVLLYGPPGTGKTMLARAVAKESRATVLEVSGADLNNMWVGEGEKNVKAVFSLAKKLTPCIVFIDEADAILGSRGASSSRASHRELINQFLREWDGMGELSAFIMVATNRPFDLDEATLRRLPRRMLVDLPTEKDREEILKIHLRDEILDSQISLQQLAVETPLYSGSDLKNLCVAAALACVREEYDADTASAFSDNTTTKGNTGLSIPSSSLTSITTAEANGLTQESSSVTSARQPASKNYASKHSNSLSEALAAVSSSSNTLSKSLSLVSESITSLQKPSTSLASTSLAKPTDPQLRTSIVHPTDSPLIRSDPSASSYGALRDSDSKPSASARVTDPFPLENSSSPSKAKVSTPKRILRRHHFERALEEITASVSDDMRSLTQIRKFDEKFGDRRARKGRLGGRYGFGTLNEKEREKVGESAARVRIGQPT